MALKKSLEPNDSLSSFEMKKIMQRLLSEINKDTRRTLTTFGIFVLATIVNIIVGLLANYVGSGNSLPQLIKTLITQVSSYWEQLSVSIVVLISIFAGISYWISLYESRKKEQHYPDK